MLTAPKSKLVRITQKHIDDAIAARKNGADIVSSCVMWNAVNDLKLFDEFTVGMSRIHGTKNDKTIHYQMNENTKMEVLPSWKWHYLTPRKVYIRLVYES